MTIMPGAEPYRHDGGPVGVLLCHGFTSTPASVRPWAEHLAAAGLSVVAPRLPGHGTDWRDMAGTTWRDWYAEVDRAYLELAGRCERVAVMGQSLGGCLALLLAQRRGPGVAALVLVNPSLAADNRLLHVGHAVKYLVSSVAGLAGDIKKAGGVEMAYDRVPTRAAAGLPALWRTTRTGLDLIEAPLLVYRSLEDHVVGPASLRVLRAGVRSTVFDERVCEDSYHVATLDNDAEKIFSGSLEFVREHVGKDLKA
ncbi:MAG: alpha/beta fold hydrolase [Streptosporangiales bacterium]|nr:alpha/beta fold hydrolase [Streptosporangiales bacterium]